MNRGAAGKHPFTITSLLRQRLVVYCRDAAVLQARMARGAAVNIWVALVSLIILSACSHANAPQRSRIAGGEMVTCRQVTPTGSHMMRTVCTSAAERRKQEEEGRSLMEEERRRRSIEDATRQTLRETRRPGT